MNGLKSLSEIFNNSVFRIPDYQRGYAWGESQLQDFWNDLVNLVDKHDHYTGMLSLKEIDTDNDEGWSKSDNWIIDEGYKAYYVIDGQQRLTTSIILIYCIISFCKRNGVEYLGNNKISDIESRFIRVSPVNSKYNKLFLFSYVKDDPSKNYLIYEIFENNSKPTLNETYYTLNLKHAKESFEEKITDLFNKNEGKVETLESLYKKLVNRFKFNIFAIENDFDVSVAFETMNNRGKKLSTLEILKNRLIYLTTVFSNEDLSELDKVTLRNEINTAWAEIYTQIGRNKNASLKDDDDFLRNHWNMYYQYYKTKGINYITDLLNRRFTVNRYFGNDAISYEIFSDPTLDEQNDNFDDIENEDSQDNIIDEKDDDIIENKLTPDMVRKYVNSLMNSAKYYYFVNNPDDAAANINITNEEVAWLKRIKRLGFVSFTPMLMALLINKDKIDINDRKTILKDIENIIFIVFRCSGYLSTYRANAFFTAARKLYKSANAKECIKFLEDELTKVKKNFNQYFKGKITKLISDGGGFFRWNELRYFLFEYEQYLSTNTSSPTSIIESDYFNNKAKNNDSVSIEHILPQTIEEDYGYWINAVRGYSEKEINILTNSLGNLLPLSQSINSSFQNEPFYKKKSSNRRNNRGYENGSLSEREVAKNEERNPNTILERGLKLLEFFEKRWQIEFYTRDSNESDDSYIKNRNKAMTELLSLSFINDGRVIPEKNEEIPFDEVEIYSNEDKKVELISVSSNYYANLYYYKIQKELKAKGIEFKAVKTRAGYVGLRRLFEDKKFALFANIWFQKDKLRIDTNKPEKNGIGEFKGDDYSLNFNYIISVDENTDINVVIEELVESFNKENTANEIGVDKVIDTINQIISVAKSNNKDFIEISAYEIQDKLGLKRAAGLICDAMNSVKTNADVIIYQPKKKTLSYKIRFDLLSRNESL